MRINQFSPARWAIAFFVPMLPVICATALYTYLVDPLWQWPHSHHLERWHRDFNERLQKTNYLASRKVNIDTLILGTSRSTYFRAEWAGSENVFNYATAAAMPFEFAERIEYAKKRSNVPLKLILVEASERYMFDHEDDRIKEGFYIENAEDAAKKARNLFSLSALGYALQTRKKPEYAYYLVNSFGEPMYKSADMEFAGAEKKRQAGQGQMNQYASLYTCPYIEGYSRYFADIRKAAGDVEVIIYTMPVSWQLMKLFAEMGHIGIYEECLRALVAEFGKVYHFFYPNPTVMNDGNFVDNSHPSAAAAEQIISIIMSLRSGEIEEDSEHGGILLTNENIEELLPRFRREMEELVASSF